ncbi:MAG: glycosyltransferase, partial [Acidimicrobiales bacterium]
FPGFAAHDVRTMPVDRVPLLRGHHRLAFPLLAPSFSALHLDADVVVCSSTGWAHGATVSGRKIVYCHSPARWLYQTARYLGDRHGWARWPVEAIAVPLRAWDRRAALSAHRYLVNSTVVRDRVRAAYGIEAEILPPPSGLDATGPEEAVPGLDAGFVLCISRLLEYKNVGAVVEAFSRLPGERLVVAGTGPLLDSLRRSAPSNVVLLGAVPEAQLRWLYRSCAAVVAASYEDFGLTPVEGLGYGKPTAALRWGGFIDTIREGETGVFFDQPRPDEIAAATRALLAAQLDPRSLTTHAQAYSRERFVARIRAVVAEERSTVR